MTHFLLMVHSEFCEKLLQKVFMRIPFINIVTVPFDLCTAPAETHIPELHTILRNNQISTNEIRYICVEANYGHAASFDLNTQLIDEMLLAFPDAKIGVYSGTIPCLVKALAYHPRLQVVGKGQDILTEISGHYGRALLKEEAERIFSVAQFRDSISAENSELSRTRTMSDPQAFIPWVENRVRSPSLPTYTPMYSEASSSSEKTSSKPTSGNNSTEQLSKNSNNFKFL
jgi:hypothetical protein